MGHHFDAMGEDGPCSAPGCRCPTFVGHDNRPTDDFLTLSTIATATVERKRHERIMQLLDG